MFCEYCKVHLADVEETRRHIIHIGHVRNKNEYELNRAKYFDRSRQARMHPVNFEKLCQELNLHSERDVDAMDKNNFFKLDRKWHADVAEELFKTLQNSSLDYALKRLHPPVRAKLLEVYEEERAAKKNTEEEAEQRREGEQESNMVIN